MTLEVLYRRVCSLDPSIILSVSLSQENGSAQLRIHQPASAALLLEGNTCEPVSFTVTLPAVIL